MVCYYGPIVPPFHLHITPIDPEENPNDRFAREVGAVFIERSV
jgi:hypothetical protein